MESSLKMSASENFFKQWNAVTESTQRLPGIFLKIHLKVWQNHSWPKIKLKKHSLSFTIKYVTTKYDMYYLQQFLWWEDRQMELCRPRLDWTLSVTLCLYHRFFFNPLIFLLFTAPSPLSSFSMSDWILLENFRVMTKNLKWALSTAQEKTTRFIIRLFLPMTI